MLALIVIFTASFLLVPLIELTLNERVRIPVKITVYILALFALLYLFVRLRVA